MPRKILLLREEIMADGETRASKPVTRVAACAIFANPLSGEFDAQASLESLMQAGAEFGETLTRKALALLDSAPQAYGKGAIIGASGALEHGAALLHPLMGRPMRQVIGGGDALIPSNVKIGGPGTTLDVPISHRNDAWLFDFLDTMTLSCPDGPLAHEILVAIVLSDGGRPNPRVTANKKPKT